MEDLIVNSNQKNGVSAGPLRILPKESMGLGEGRHWEGEETVDYMGCWESHIQNLPLFVTLRAFYVLLVFSCMH